MEFDDPIPDQGIYVDAEQYLGLERDRGEKAPETILVFGFAISKFSPTTKIVTLALFALISHHIYCTMQEWVAAKNEPDLDSYLTFVNTMVFVVYTQYLREDLVKPKSPLNLMALVGVLQAIVLYLVSKASVSSTPGALLAFKSMQVVPVLVLRVFLLQKRYLLWDYMAVGLMVLGITIFSVVGYPDGIKADLTASMCMVAALLINGVINAFQERILSHHQSSYAELVYFSQLTTAAILFTSFILRGQVTRVLFSPSHSTQLLCLLFSFVGYAAMMAVLLLMRSYGCVAAVLVTSSRRLATGIAGIFMLQGGLGFWHLIGLFVFATGIVTRGAHWLQHTTLSPGVMFRPALVHNTPPGSPTPSPTYSPQSPRREIIASSVLSSSSGA